MQRHQILQNLFGYQSEEEVASNHEMNHQPIYNSDENDGGTQPENESISKQGIKIKSGAELDEATRSSWYCDGGSKFENKSISRQGVKIETGAELNDDARSSWYCDGGPKFGNTSILGQGIKVENAAELNYQARSSRLTEIEEDEDKVRLKAVIRAVFGDSDSDSDEPAEYGVQDDTNHGENNFISPQRKVNNVKELKSEGIITDEDTPYVPEEEKPEVKLEGQSAPRLQVFEIPQLTPVADPPQMATIKLSNIIGIDHKPFDPATYVEEDFYVTDATGSKRLIPPSNIIRWRKVMNPDGTTTVESNAKFVTWSDGSLQLFIGNKAFDVSEENADEIQSHVFRWNEGIYKVVGRICKTVKVESSSLLCNSNRVTALVNSQDKEAHDVGHGNTHVNPEMVEKQSKQAERQTTKDNARIQKKYNKKATHKCKPKDSKEHLVLPSNVEDESDEVCNSFNLLRTWQGNTTPGHLERGESVRDQEGLLGSPTKRNRV